MVLLTAKGRCRTSERQEGSPVPSLKRAEKSSAIEAPIDLGPLGNSIGYLVRRAQITIFQRFFELFAEADIRPVQYSILAVIESNPGLSQTHLAAALEQAVVFPTQIHGADRRSARRAEHQALILPPFPRREPLLELSEAMIVQRLDGDGRQEDRAS